MTQTGIGNSFRLLPLVVMALGCKLFNTSAFFKVASFLIVLVYIVIPLIYYFTDAFSRNMVFASFVNWPFNVNFHRPIIYGVKGARNFYLNTEDGVKIGVWHILPDEMVAEYEQTNENSELQTSSFHEEALGKHYPVVIYMHGNGGNRAGPYRRILYGVLQSLNYHVVAFDYRGYGDSTKVPPTEVGVVIDGKTVYRWVKKFVKDAPIIFWGHSLGTGVSSRTVSELIQAGEMPKALILESPFNNLYEEVRNHKLTYVFRWMPFFDTIFIGPLKRMGVSFESDRYVQNITCPILILHSEDDPVIPFKLAKKLYDSAQNGRPKGSRPVEFIAFERSEGFGHKFMVNSPMLPMIISKFIASSILADACEDTQLTTQLQ